MKKSLVNLSAALGGCLLGGVSVFMLTKKGNDANRGNEEKFKKYYHVLNQWMILKQEHKEIQDYFIENGYKKIAIYGMGELGNRLYEELKNSDVEVSYAIDQNLENIYSDLKIVSINDDLDDVDAIIVTAMFAYEEVEKALECKINADIISLEEVIFKF